MSNRICNDHAPRPHNEAICHATGEKRQNIINKLKMFLDKVDDRPCLLQDQSPKRKPMMKYPGYVDYHHPAFKMEKLKDCRNPPVQQIIIDNNCKNDKESRRMSDDYKMRMPAQQQEDYKDLELRGGDIYKTCFCIRANGVQDQCPLSDCQGKEECMAVNPGPCCKPALTRLCEMQKEKHRQAQEKTEAIHYEDRCQNMNLGGRQLNMNSEDKPRTLKCICYYD